MRRFYTPIKLRSALSKVVLLVAVFTACLPALAMADGALSEAFTTTETSLATGSLLSLKDNTKDVVEKATLQTQNQLIGVVGNNTLVALGGSKNQVQTVVTGLAPVLSSNINGDIKSGDSLAVSPINGVAMKATGAGMVIGVAQSNFSQVATTTHSINDNAGKQQSVKIGLINAQIDVTYYAPAQDKIKPLLPSFLVSVGRTIAGKDVTGIRIVVGVFVLLLGFLTVIVMLQVGIRSSISAIGRNPLAHKEIRRSLIDVTITALGVLILTVMIIYFILTV